MKWFKDDDFQCKCGCGFDITDELKDLCDKARDLAQIPFIVNSGARCLSHNRNEGSRDTSSHVKGIAVDIATSSSSARFKVIQAFMKLGVSRFGINFNKNFIHIDIDTSKPQELIFGY